MKKVWKILRIVLLSLLGIPVLYAGNYVVQSQIMKVDYPTLFKMGSSTILTGSMSPTIEAGDMVFTVKQVSYEVGDIITFTSGDSFVTHRIVETDGTYYYTQGDANNVRDDEVLTVDDIKGKVVFHLKGIGKVSLFLKSTYGFIFMIALFALVFEISLWPLNEKPVNLEPLEVENTFDIAKVKKILFKKKETLEENEQAMVDFLVAICKPEYTKDELKDLAKTCEKYFSNDFLEQLEKIYKEDDFINKAVGEFINDLKPKLVELGLDDKVSDKLYAELLVYKVNITNNIMDVTLTQNEKRKLFVSKGLIKVEKKVKTKKEKDQII